ncbi:MAG: helix-turn-helix domain-containing protein [Nitrospira sp.]|nr:helix-turn-helix domain-containing protein [Nitrospira sp.]
MSDQSSPFMTLKEAAAFLRYSPSTLYQRADIPRIKLPGSKDWRYEKQALLAWAASAVPQRLEPQHEPPQLAAENPQAPRPVLRRRSSRYR